MTDTTITDKTDATVASPDNNDNQDPNNPDNQPPKNPITEELNRIKQPKTEAEKAAFTLQMNAKRVKELGLNPLEIIGGTQTKPEDKGGVDDDSRPVTFADLNRLKQQEAAQTAVSLATSQIEDEHERELTIHHLEHTIKPSGDAQTDLKNARAIVNSVKNGMIAQEIARKPIPANHAGGAGAPAKPSEEVFVPTEEEQVYMRAPFNLSKEEVLKARRDNASKA